MTRKKRTIDIEAIKWHILLRLYRNDKPVSVGQIKSELIGYSVNYDDVYDNLFHLDQILPVAGGIQLTDEGQNYLERELKEERRRILHWITEDEFELAVLDFLYHRPHLVKLEDFPELLIKKAPQHGNSVGYGNLTQAIFHMDAYVENPVMSWYGITEIGRDFYLVKKRKTGESMSARSSGANGSFTESEKRELNIRLDEILRKLEQINLENETIWTDMKADFEELRNLFDMGKKNWRQLFVGKLTEWTAGGIISETISKQIVEAIKVETGKLLG